MKSPDISFHDDEIKKMMEELEAHETEEESEPKVSIETMAEDILVESEPVVAPVKEKKVRAKAEPVKEEITGSVEFDEPAVTEALKKVVKEAPAPKSSLNYFIDPAKFSEDVKVTEATLDSCMFEQAGLRAWYTSQAAGADFQYSAFKIRFDVLEAQLYSHHRKELTDASEKVTEKMIETEVRKDSRWIAAKERLNEADQIANVNRGLVSAISDRQSMLIQLCADRREGLKGASRMLAVKEDRESLSARAIAAAQH